MCLSIEVESPTLRYFSEIQPYLLGTMRIYHTLGRVPTAGLQTLLKQNKSLYQVLCQIPNQMVKQRHQQSLPGYPHRHQHHESNSSSHNQQTETITRMDATMAFRALVALVEDPKQHTGILTAGLGGFQ